MKEAVDCERRLDDSKDMILAVEGPAKEIVRTGSASLVSEATLEKKIVLAVLRRRMTKTRHMTCFSAHRMFQVTSGIPRLFCTGTMERGRDTNKGVVVGEEECVVD